MRTETTFVRSAAGGGIDRTSEGSRALALIGRSNVGKSSLINALVRRRVARTSATPGKTRLANIYRVERGTARPLYLVDLPGYGYARGGEDAARAFDELAQGFVEQAGRDTAALLLVDARHPGLVSDRAAWTWLRETVADRAIVATKIDKLARGRRIRALGAFESVFDDPVLPVSAVTGEGLDELWKLIDKLTHRRQPMPRSPSRAEARPSA